MKDQICFYNDETQGMVAAVDSAMVPTIGSHIVIMANLALMETVELLEN